MGFATLPRLCWGPGALEILGSLGARRVFLVVDPAVARSLRLRRIVEEFEKGGAAVTQHLVARIEPTLESVDAAAASARSAGPDWVVAVGGGSTIDTAKAAWVGYERPEFPFAEPIPTAELGLRARARFAALPTTSGSGAEASWLAQYRGADGALVEISSRDLVADWVLLDPQLAELMPPDVTAATGADAIAHAFEAYFSPWANPFTDALARDAIARAARDLPRVYRHGSDPELRLSMQFAATHAGVAAANSQLGLAHALAHAVGGEVPLPHGRLVAAVLPSVIEYNFPSVRDRLDGLPGPLGAGAAQHRSTLPERLRDLWQSLGLPRSLAEVGVPPTTLEGARDTILARAASSSSWVGNPRVPSPTELRAVFDAAVGGRAVDV
ncbi:MAG TPA: iron-containing alcohol dehydrogenase [Thermoplasmata archaeon]|nr:iron-containing alcohol dehydrogenase [Thermoplasmata archaeon]